MDISLSNLQDVTRASERSMSPEIGSRVWDVWVERVGDPKLVQPSLRELTSLN